MKLVVTACLLVNLVYAVPSTDSNITGIIEQIAIYTAEFDIVNILYPTNALNGKRHTYDFDGNDKTSPRTQTIFFVIAEKSTGQIAYKGLYVYKNEDVKKILDNGRDAIATNDDSKEVYFAASDGIYFFNAEKNKAEKYGTITDNIIGIAKCNGSDVFYILTADHALYKVTEGGTKKEIIPDIENPQQIVVDYRNNLYYTSQNNVYVYNNNRVKKFENLPKDWGYAMLLRPPVILMEGISLIIDNVMYIHSGL